MSRVRERVRLDNLNLLIAEAGSAAALARRANTSESYLSQIRNQLTTPKGTPRAVGDNLATKLERAMGKTNGWMDEMHREVNSVHDTLHGEPPTRDIHGLHALISWDKATQWPTISGNFSAGEAEDLLPCPVRCSQNTFVLRVRGESMEPKFHDGDLIFVDPDVEPISGKYVVVQFEHSQEASFKQLIVEDGQKYLKAANPDWPQRIIELDKSATICGVVVFKGELV
ncbi:MAG: LexA family protein [Gammaproteobacteria bacterium]